MKSDIIPGHPGSGRILDPDWIDIGLLKKWKQECIISHVPNCKNPMKIWSVRPAWLVDAQNQCLVPGTACGDYVALSYRWGQPSDHMRHYPNMMDLQEHNALHDSKIAAYLAPVVWHAIYLTAVIGERFLWVDAVCIDHNDEQAAKEQLNLMGAIYANAIVTIISTDSDAQDGIPGLKGISLPRQLEQRVIPFGDEQLIVRNASAYNSDTPYFERGWTYQEYQMSQRRIIFNTHEAHWQCRSNVWHEELSLEAMNDEYVDPRPSVILAGFPDLSSLGHGLQNHNQRQLCYEEDALPGISGLLSVMSRAFPGGFLYGLPEMFFDRCLGWQPLWSFTDLKQRLPSQRSNSSQFPHSALPSWSWIGWQGLIDGWSDEAVSVNRMMISIKETFPITVWYTSGSPSIPLNQRRRIRSTWFENRDDFKDLTKPLPMGWTRHKVSEQPQDSRAHCHPDKCGEYVFKHSEMPDRDLEYWYYPFPVTNIQDSTLGFSQEQTPYLFCETKKAQLWGHLLGHMPEYGDLAKGGNIVELRDKSSTKIGTLHLHNERQRDIFPLQITGKALGKPVDLVAIYRSRIYSKTWDEDYRRYTYPVRTHEEYVVLWVEKKEGVYYRLASGSVERSAWEALDLEETSLTLG